MAEAFQYTLVYYINMVVFLTAISIRIGLLSSKIHNGDDTPKDLIGGVIAAYLKLPIVFLPNY